MSHKYMVAAKNDEGRVCGWATGNDLHDVKLEALRQYNDHSCHPWEEYGSLIYYKRNGRDFLPFKSEDLEIPICVGCNEIVPHDGKAGGLSIAPTDELGEKYGDEGRCIACWAVIVEAEGDE